MNEQTLKQERKHYERECLIRKAVKTVRAESLAKKRERAEEARILKEIEGEL
tara:strand:+ start:561 stop:716 length:156 start_codon:yes stop_codon:yes gene_type:complete